MQVEIKVRQMVQHELDQIFRVPRDAKMLIFQDGVRELIEQARVLSAEDEHNLPEERYLHRAASRVLLAVKAKARAAQQPAKPRSQQAPTGTTAYEAERAANMRDNEAELNRLFSA